MRGDLSWLLVQAPAWSGANFRVCPGPCLVEFGKCPRMETEHPFQAPLPISCGAQGRIFSYVQLEFPSCSLGCCLSFVTVLFGEGSGSVYTTHLFHHPNHHEYNKINLKVICLFVFFSVLPFLLLYSVSDWQPNLVFCLLQAITYLGCFKARPCFYLVLLKKSS